jgi:CheY-like chemotaxis protein
VSRELVLVVYPDSDLRHVLCRRLTILGYEVRAAATGAEALEKAAARAPALVVLDMLLPDIDGWTVPRRMRDAPGTHESRAVVVSTLDEPYASHECCPLLDS